MKPFDLRVYFTGICATVPNDPDLGSATRALVVMPGANPATHGRKKALDGETLCPHQSFAWFDLKNVGEKGADVTVKMPLNQRRLTFDADEANSDLNNFHVVTKGNSSIYNLLQLEYAAPDYCVLDPACGDPRPPSILQTQVDIPRGELSSIVALNPWRFPDTLGGKPVRRYCARYSILKLYQLTRLDLVAWSFDGASREVLHLTPAIGETEVEIVISNSCIDYPDPPWGSVAGSGYALADVDFRWYYELLPKPTRDTIVEKLDGLPLPFPYPVTRGTGPFFINHGNCWPMLAFTKARQP